MESTPFNESVNAAKRFSTLFHIQPSTPFNPGKPALPQAVDLPPFSGSFREFTVRPPVRRWRDPARRRGQTGSLSGSARFTSTRSVLALVRGADRKPPDARRMGGLPRPDPQDRFCGNGSLVPRFTCQNAYPLWPDIFLPPTRFPPKSNGWFLE
jgi:hypothetical protein